MSNDLKVYYSRVIKDQATVLKGSRQEVVSRGKCKTRLQFTHISSDENDTVGKSVRVAIQVLSDKQAKQEKISLNLFQKFRWIPTQILNEQDEKIWVLVNKRSAQKRLNLSLKEVEDVCASNELGHGFNKEDVQRTEYLLENWTDSNMQRAHQVMQNLKDSLENKLTNSLPNKLGLNPNNMIKLEEPGCFGNNYVFYKNNEFYFFENPKNTNELPQGSHKELLSGCKFETREACALLRSFQGEGHRSQGVHEKHILEAFQGEPGFPLLYGSREQMDLIFICEKKYQGDLESATGLTKLQKVEIARDMLKGLRTLHKRGYMHGDMKPKNSLWALTGKKHAEGVNADFGFTTKLSARQGPVAGGTFVYLAPEAYLMWKSDDHGLKQGPQEDSEDFQERIHQKQGAAIDMWAAGLTFYELFQNNLSNQKFSDEVKGLQRTLDRIYNWEKNKAVQLRQHNNKDALIRKGIEKQWLKWIRAELAKQAKAGKKTNDLSNFFTKPDEKNERLDYLIWLMLQIDPGDRIAAEEALKEMEALLLSLEENKTEALS